MSGTIRKVVGVIATYVMLVVLVCPIIPTPTYLFKDKSGSHHTATVALEAVASLVADPGSLHQRRLEFDSRRETGIAVLERTCQRLC